MQSIRDLIEAVQNGQRPVVTFKAGIDDKESYAEAGMRARIIGLTPPDQDGTLKLRFEFAEFDAHNVAFESANYFDKHQKPVLTARQAGFYRPQEDLYFDIDEPLSELMTLEDNEACALFDAYKAEKSPLTYLNWLEKKVLALEAGQAKGSASL